MITWKKPTLLADGSLLLQRLSWFGGVGDVGVGGVYLDALGVGNGGVVGKSDGGGKSWRLGLGSCVEASGTALVSTDVLNTGGVNISGGCGDAGEFGVVGSASEDGFGCWDCNLCLVGSVVAAAFLVAVLNVSVILVMSLVARVIVVSAAAVCVGRLVVPAVAAVEGL